MNLFSDDIVSEYQKWRKANPNNFSWWNFVNMKANLDTALAFAKFYCPEIIEIEECCFLKDKYNYEIYESWKQECKGNKKNIEMMVNLYQICDFFEINETDNEREKIVALGNILKFFWTTTFEKMYPDKKLKVEIYEEPDEELFITVYSEE
ncbi:MAG: hypothetical protein J6A58_00025 [Oscillospiraceae bacterium]|nr:hypothetical protein [Oscillospiraceae bacterium]